MQVPRVQLLGSPGLTKLLGNQGKRYTMLERYEGPQVAAAERRGSGSSTLLWEQVAKVPGVAKDDLTWPQPDLAVKGRASENERMKLSVLAAQIDSRR